MADRLPAGFVTNREIAGPLAADKLTITHEQTERFGFNIGDTPTTKEVILFVADKAGTIIDAGAGLNDSGTSTSIAFDLKKNGSTGILSAAITVVHGTGDRVEVAGSIASGAYAAGDVISGIMTVTSSTGAQGPWLRVKRTEVGD